MSKTVGQWVLELLDDTLHADEPKTATEWALEMIEEEILEALQVSSQGQLRTRFEVATETRLFGPEPSMRRLEVTERFVEYFLRRLKAKGLAVEHANNWWRSVPKISN